jgi:putative DNA primase/helicase
MGQGHRWPALDDLEETMATMLDQSRTPPKAALLHGPSRSGKSTFLRLMTAIAGHENTSAVSLHQLSEDRFASANLYGKILNVAADISADHVRDLSLWKMLTGEDRPRRTGSTGRSSPSPTRR